MKTSTKTLAAALRVLAAEIQSPDGISSAVIAEAAERLEEQEVWKDLATVAFTRGELTPEHKESCKKTTFCKEYDGESLHDISRDIHESFDERFNPVIAEIPVDKYGIQKGVFKVTIDWYSE